MAYVDIEDDVYNMLQDDTFIEELVAAMRERGYCITKQPESCDKEDCCKHGREG